MDTTPPITHVRRSLVAALYTIAYALDLHIHGAAGSALLKLPEAEDWPDLDDFDLAPLDLVGPLEVVYRYAFHGEIGDARIDDDWEGNSLGRFMAIQAFANTWVIQNNFDDIIAMFGGDKSVGEGFHRMLDLANARYHVDHHSELEINHLVLLTGMTERSLRNALHGQGIPISKEQHGERVNVRQVLPWLKTRYRETVRVGTLGEVPDHLEADQILDFIRTRIQEILELTGSNLHDIVMKSLGHEVDPNYGFFNLVHKVGWTKEQGLALLNGTVNDISPDDCPAIARMLELDSRWWTNQVMHARFPDAMKEIAPSVATPVVKPSSFNEQENTLEAILTEAGIRNGYIDIERRYADRFFPADSFGTKGSEQYGKEVLLHHDLKQSPYASDIRIKSRALVSPRKRFNAYFKVHDAKVGDVIQIKRLSERDYQLTFQSK